MRQTLDEIRAAYPREWVLIVDCEFDEEGNLVAGTVAAHSKRRDDVYREIPRYRGGAVEFFGDIPSDYAAVL